MRYMEVGSMLKTLFSNLFKLIDVKSLVTLACTYGYIMLTLKGKITPDLYQVTYTTIIGFYFGIQVSKNKTNGRSNNLGE